MRTSTLALAVVVLCGCSSPAPEKPPPVGRTAAPIVGGNPSTAAQDSVIFIQIGTDGFCSGTLIAPNLVLTARHCVANMDESTECGTFLSDNDPSTFSIAVGANTDQNNPNTVAQGIKVIDDGQSSGCSHDVALIQLDHDLPGAKISPVRQAPTTKGEVVTAVGFGDDGSGTLTNGRYQRAGIAILAVGPANFTYTQQDGTAIPVNVPVGEIGTGESTCYGDSGGPIFDSKGAVVGVTSRGTADSCIDAPSIYSDVASHYAMIAQAASTAGHPLVPTGGGKPDGGGGGGGGDGGKPKPGRDGGGAPGGDDGSGDDPFAGGGDLSPGVPAPAGSGTAPAANGGTTPKSAGCAVGARTPDGSWLFVIGAIGLVGTRRRRARG